MIVTYNPETQTWQRDGVDFNVPDIPAQPIPCEICETPPIVVTASRQICGSVETTRVSDFLVILDSSESMFPDKYPIVVDALEGYFESLEDTVTQQSSVTFIRFGSYAESAFTFALSDMAAGFAQLRSSGSLDTTDYSAALLAGISALSAFPAEQATTVLFASDGQPTSPVPQDLLDQWQAAAATGERSVYTVGITANEDYSEMEGIQRPLGDLTRRLLPTSLESLPALFSTIENPTETIRVCP